MKKIIFLFLILFIAGCSSKSTTSKTAKKKSTTNRSESVAKSDSPSSFSQNAPVDANYAALSEAVRNKKLDVIYSQSVQLLTKNPQDIKAMNALALYHFWSHRSEAAKLFLARAIKIQPTAELYNNLAVVIQTQGDLIEATKTYRKALELQNSNQASNINLGSLLMYQGDIAKGSGALSSVSSSASAVVLNNIAIASVENGNFSQAKLRYEDALKMNPTSEIIQMNYAILLIEYLKSPNEGLEVINKLKFTGIDADNRELIGSLEQKARAIQK